MHSSQIKIIRSETKRLTKDEAEQALAHAAAIIRLVQSLDKKKYGEAADQWLSKYT